MEFVQQIRPVFHAKHNLSEAERLPFTLQKVIVRILKGSLSRWKNGIITGENEYFYHKSVIKQHENSRFHRL